METPVHRIGRTPAVTEEEKSGALRIGEYGKLRDRPVRVCNDAIEKDPEMVGHSGDSVRAEQTAVILYEPVHAFPFCQRQRQVEPRSIGEEFQGSGADIMHCQFPRGGVLQDEHDLEYGVVAGISFRPQFLHQLLERHVLMRICPERRLSYPPQEFNECRTAGKVRAQHQGIGEKTDHVFDLHTVAVRNGAPDDNIVPTGIAVEQRHECREERHEKGRPFSKTELPEGPGQIAGQFQVMGRGEGGRDLIPRPGSCHLK